MAPDKWRVCSNNQCAELVNRQNPCPKHGRPLTASWSKDRDTSAHLKQRRQVIQQRGPRCERCGWEAEDRRGKGLQMHHLSPTQVLLTCRPCHKALDKHAR